MTSKRVGTSAYITTDNPLFFQILQLIIFRKKPSYNFFALKKLKEFFSDSETYNFLNIIILPNPNINCFLLFLIPVEDLKYFVPFSPVNTGL